MQQWGQETVAKFFGGEFHFRLSGDKSEDEFVKDVEGMIARSHDMRPVMIAIGHYLMGSTARTFQAEGRPRSWSPLKPKTIEDRIRKGYGPGPILQRSKTLLRSLTEPGARGSLLRAGPKSLKYGSRLIYFNTHQHGDTSRNIPARPMIILQKQDRSQISRIINTYIRTGKIKSTMGLR